MQMPLRTSLQWNAKPFTQKKYIATGSLASLMTLCTNLCFEPKFSSSRVSRILSTSLHICCFEKLFKYKALFQILCQSNVSKHEDEIEDCVLFDLSGLEVQFQSSELWKHFRVTSVQMEIIFKSAKLLNDRTLGILKFCPHLCGAFEDQVYCGEESKTW